MTKAWPTFFTSDWHVHHKSVIDFDNRPFTDMDHMHEVLINNYNASVTDNSVCYFLGDFSMGSPDETTEILRQLNGTKILVIGNHDRTPSAMKRFGFDAVLNLAAVVIANELVTMSHCPLRGVYREDTTQMHRHEPGENWHGEFRHKNFSLDNWGQFHIHGHCHKDAAEKIAGRQFDVGVRGNKYRPVSSSEIESWIVKTKREESHES